MASAGCTKASDSEFDAIVQERFPECKLCCCISDGGVALIHYCAVSGSEDWLIFGCALSELWRTLIFVQEMCFYKWLHHAESERDADKFSPSIMIIASPVTHISLCNDSYFLSVLMLLRDLKECLGEK